jgi:hypothetical protein
MKVGISISGTSELVPAAGVWWMRGWGLVMSGA